MLDHQITPLLPAKPRQFVPKGFPEPRSLRRRIWKDAKQTKARHVRHLGSDWHRGVKRGRAGNSQDESASHSITRSARNRIEAGTFRPSILAVFRFTISSNLVGCSIGRSPGLAPLSILSIKRGTTL